MYIRKMELKNFRNYNSLNVMFNRRFNIFYGFNGHGKTNILEAIYICASGRSHRTTKDMEMINLGKNEYYIRMNINRKDNPSSIEILYEKKKKKKVKINEIPVRKLGNLMGNLNVVMFSPEDIMIIKEGPSERRRFIDITISQIRPSYFFDLQQYYKILIQRNNLLKEIQEKRNLIDTLDVWDENLIKTGSRIIIRRNEFVRRLSNYTNENHRKLTKGKESLKIEYSCSLGIKGDKCIKEIEKIFKEKIEKNREKEIYKGITIYGPQRDDYDILLNDMAIKMYGSQGQQRTAILSIKLSEIDIMKEETDEYPVLLLDDVMSELDNKRKKYLLDSLKNIQTFITCTDKEFFKNNVNSEARYLNVKNGKIEEC